MKILSIIKINLCALLAIPLLLLATCFRLITKAFEKIPVFLIEGLVIFVVVGMISVLKLPKNMGELIWHIILACIGLLYHREHIIHQLLFQLLDFPHFGI